MTDIATTLELARGGDTGAFAQIVRQYQSLVSGVLFNATGDFHKSEDIAQETFLIAWQKLGELRDPNHLAAWLCTIARNLAHRSHRKPTVPTVPLLTEPQSEDCASPDAELLRREQSEFVWSAIGEIDETHRETLVLYYRSGQSVREIANAMESTEEAVRQRLVRARKSLKAKMEEMIGNILTDTAPNEMFTMTVMAAVGAAMVSTTVGCGTVAVATGTGGKTLGSATIWSVIGQATIFGWIAGVFFAALWAEVRNAPTLRSRRVMVYSNFLFIMCFGPFCCGLAMFIGMLVWCSAFMGPNMGTTPSVYAAFLTVFAVTAVFCSLVFVSIHLIIRRKIKGIIKNDLGLPVAHVESYSYPQIERLFFLSIIANFLAAITVFAFFLGVGFFAAAGGFTHPFFLISTFCIIAITVVLFAVYYPLGRYFLEICRTKENFLAAPPLVNNPFEVTLAYAISAPPATPDYSKKIGSGMFGVMLVMWLGLIGCGIWYFSWYSWDKHPISLAICVFIAVAILAVHLVCQKKTKEPRIVSLWDVLVYFYITGLILALEYIEFGGVYFSDAWSKAFAEDPRNPIRFANMAAITAPIFMLPVQLYYWFAAKQLEGDSDRLLREAISHFDPATMIADEPEVAAKPFPRHWIWIIGLYAAAIVVLWCVGVLLI